MIVAPPGRRRRLARVLIAALFVQGLPLERVTLGWPFESAGAPSTVAGAPTGAPPWVALTNVARAQVPPPSYVPLPSPISVGRGLSAFTVDALNAGALTITYTVFNARDEAVGEPVLVTTLAAGVNLVSASPEANQPTSTDGRLAFVLPSIPPFGEETVTLTVSVPTGGSGPVTVDDGARAFGNLRTRAVQAAVPPTTLPRTLGASADHIACTIDTNTACPNGPASPPDQYVLQKLGEIGCDPVAAFELVRDHIGYESYRGSLRGARGTLWSSAGNALDRASLLVGLLRACGTPARYVSGILDDPTTRDLIASMFAPTSRAVGGLPASSSATADPVNAPELLAASREHFWVEAFDGSSFVAMDPTGPSAVVGQALAAPVTRFTEIDPARRHTVRMRLIAELTPVGLGVPFFRLADALGTSADDPTSSVRTLLIGGSIAVQTRVLDHTFATVELVGEPISFGHFVEKTTLPGLTANSYSPWMQIGERDTISRGADYQETFTPLGNQILTGLILRIDVSDGVTVTKQSERFLIDRTGSAIRAGDGFVALTADPSAPPIITDQDVVSVTVTAARENRTAIGDAVRRLEESASAFAPLAAQLELIGGVRGLTPAEQALVAAAAPLGRDVARHVTRAVTRSFVFFSDVMDAQLGQGLASRIYYDSPRVIVSSARAGSQPSIDLDLRINEARPVPAPGQQRAAASIVRFAKGLFDGALEHQIMSVVTGAEAISTLGVVAAATSSALVGIGAETFEKLDELEVSANARAEMAAAVAAGHAVLAPRTQTASRAVWLDFDPATGHVVPVVEGGGHQAFIEYAALFFFPFAVSGPAGYVLGASAGVQAVLAGVLGAAGLTGPEITAAAQATAAEVGAKLGTALAKYCPLNAGAFTPILLTMESPLADCIPSGPNGLGDYVPAGAPEAITAFCCFATGFQMGAGVSLRSVDPGLTPLLEDPDLGLGAPGPLPQTTLTVQGSLSGTTVSGALSSDFLRMEGNLSGLPVPSTGVLAAYPTAVTSGLAVGGVPASLTTSTNFAPNVEATLVGATINVEAAEGSATLAGTLIEAPVNVALAGCSGSVEATDAAATDAVALSAGCGRILVTSVSPAVGAVERGGTMELQPTLLSNADDSYVLEVEGPPGWKVHMAADGTMSLMPSADAMAGTFETRLTARSTSVPGLVAEARALVTVTEPATPELRLRLVTDETFSVPHMTALAPSSYRIEMENAGPAGDMFDLALTGIDPADYVQAVPAVFVAPWSAGVIGVALRPAAGVLPVGTPMSFTATATGRGTGLVASLSTTVPYPAVAGVSPSMAPRAVATTPGGTSPVAAILRSTGNVLQTVSLLVDAPAGLGIQGLPSSIMLTPGATSSVPFTIVAGSSLPVGTTVPLTLTVDLCNGIPAELCDVPQPSFRYASMAVAVGDPGLACIGDAWRIAQSARLARLAPALDDLHVALSRLSSTPDDTLLQSRVVAAGSALYAGLTERGRDGLAAALSPLLADVGSGDPPRVTAAIGQFCTVMGSLDDETTEMAAEAAHAFSMAFVPSGRTVGPSQVAAYVLRLENRGSAHSTIGLVLGTLPAGVTGGLSQPSVTLAPGEVIDGSSPTPVTLTLSAAAELRPAVPITVAAQVVEAPTVTAVARGSFGVRESFVDVVSVDATPRAVASAGSPVALAARLANAVNVPRTVRVAWRVEDGVGNTVVTGTPVTVGLSGGAETVSVPLGSVDTAALNGTYRAVASVQSDTGSPIPGREGRGTFLVGLPIALNVTAEPAVVPPGGPVQVVSRVHVGGGSALTRGRGFIDQYADAVVGATNATTPEDAAGTPDHRTAGIAIGGEVILDMGAGLDGLVDEPGPDLVVLQRKPSSCNEVDTATYHVDVGDHPAGPFSTLGYVYGSRPVGDEFDLAAAGVASARYVRIRAADGPVSIDAVLALHTFQPGGIEVEHFEEQLCGDSACAGVANSPVVGDIDRDGHPDVAYNVQVGFRHCEGVVLDGVTKIEKFRVDIPIGGSSIHGHGCGIGASPAMGDLDGDGEPDVLFPTEGVHPTDGGARLIAVRNDGSEIYRVAELPDGAAMSPALENVDTDPLPEIVWSRGYLEHDASPGFQSALFGQGTAADVTGDGRPELMAIGFIGAPWELFPLRPDGTFPWHTVVPGGSTPPAVADLDGDEVPDFVTVSTVRVGTFAFDRRVVAIRGDGSVLWDRDPVENLSESDRSTSRPAIADLTGDGRPEIVLSFRNGFDVDGTAVLDYVLALDADGNELWRTEASDPGGAPPGVSTADLDGDGAAEVLWNGNCDGFSILDGRTGRVLYRDPRVRSASSHDYPVAADVDADGHLEVLTGGYSGVSDSLRGGMSTGLYVFGDDTNWAGGRQVWNQSSYAITNVNDDLSIPVSKADSWRWANAFQFQGGTIAELARAGLDVTHQLASTATFDPGAIAPPPVGVSGQQVTWSSPDAPTVPGYGFTVPVALAPLSPGETRTVSESTTVDAAVTLLDGTQVTVPLEHGPVTVHAPHIVALEPASGTIAPGGATQFMVSLRNVRTTAETFTLDVLGVDPRLATIPSPVTVAAGDQIALPLRLEAFASTPAGTVDFVVVAQGDQGTVDEAGGRLGISGGAIGGRGLHVDVLPISARAGQGTSALYRIVVTNTGTVDQEVDISGVFPPGVIGDLQDRSIVVPPGLTASRQILLDVDVAVGTPAGTTSFTIIAADANDPMVRDTVEVALEVSDLGVQVDITPASTHVSPGLGQVIFDARVTNTGYQPQRFWLKPIGPLADLVRTCDSNFFFCCDGGSCLRPLDLSPGQAAYARLVFDGVDFEALLQQRTVVGVEVYADSDPGVVANDFSIVDVGAYRGIDLAFDPPFRPACAGPIDLDLLITNRGSVGDERYTMAFTSSRSGVTVTPATTQFLVPPQKTARIPLTVTSSATGGFLLTAHVSTAGDPLCTQPSCPPVSDAAGDVSVLVFAGVDGVQCDDRNACTRSDVCVAGACTGGDPILCPSSNQCRNDGTCDPSDGACRTGPPKLDGTGCNDANVCTQTDACQSGVCVGGNPRTCTALDQCHAIGTCDPVTGCPNPTKPDGAACDDGSACTASDVCHAGLCAGTPVPCLDPFLCHKIKPALPFLPLSGVSLIDRFEGGPFRVVKPTQLCPPAARGSGPLDAATHLEAYQLRPMSGAPKHVRQTFMTVTNDLGQVQLDTVKPDLLFVPTAKHPSTPPLPPDPGTHDVDNYKCYKVKPAQGSPRFPKSLQVTVSDQFTDPAKVFTLKKPRHLCVPVSIDGSGVKNPGNDLLCYLAKPVKGQAKYVKRTGVHTANRFGNQVVSTQKQNEICIPSRVCNSTITGSIAGSDPLQTGRLRRIQPASSCAASKACPGLSDSALRPYDAHAFVNSGPSTCVTVSFGSEDCSLFSAAYQGSFESTALCTGYLGDSGANGNSRTYSFDLPIGRPFTVVVHSGDGLPCQDYRLTVESCGG